MPSKASPLTTSPSTIRAAVIDLGSNSFHLLIAERTTDATPSNWLPLTHHKQLVQLARDQQPSGTIAPEAQARAEACLQQFKLLMQHHQVQQACAVGTAALRKANNREQLITHWQNVLGTPIDVIAAEREAKLTFAGLCTDSQVQETTQSFVTLDIGGASTELCLGTPQQLQQWHSLALGCLPLAQTFFTGDARSQTKSGAPSGQQALEFCLQQLDRDTTAEEAKQYRKSAFETCLGAAGTMKVIAELLYGPGATRVLREDLAALVRKIDHTPTVLDNIDPSLGSGVLPSGVCLLLALMQWLNTKELTLSPFGIKEGILAQGSLVSYPWSV